LTKLDLQYDLLNDTPANASPPEANFNRIEQHANQELIERDGTVAMRAQLRLVGDPINALDAAPKQFVDAIMPVGIIMMYGGAGAPPGGKWAVCNGAELESAAYPALFAIVGTSYVTGTVAPGRFNLPSLANRFPIGAGTAALGAVGGSADAIVPTHSHDMPHTHAAALSGNDTPDHFHGGVDHLHSPGTLSTGWQSATHSHPTSPQGQFPVVTVNPSGVVGSGGTQLFQTVFSDNTGPASADHYHTMAAGMTGPADRALTTSGAHVRHSHPIPALTYAGRTAVEGVAVANTNLPPYQAITYIIRVF
jgi:microcystin-dependent protein